MPLGIRKRPWPLRGRHFGKAKEPVGRGGMPEPPAFLHMPAPASCHHDSASSCLNYKGSEEGAGDSLQTRPSQGRMPMALTFSFFSS